MHMVQLIGFTEYLHNANDSCHVIYKIHKIIPNCRFSATGRRRCCIIMLKKVEISLILVIDCKYNLTPGFCAVARKVPGSSSNITYCNYYS